MPILGEIKCRKDQSPFYAFLQLLMYLSQLATPNQIARANCHKLFGGSIGEEPAFDLHILLVDFNDRSKKKKLVEQTRKLAEKFKVTFKNRPVGGHVGDILCLRMDQAEFESDDAPLRQEWRV